MHLSANLYMLFISALPLTVDATFAPDKIHAEKNAHAIFNSIHSAGRQWGSGIYHNGFALIPAIVPRGSIFYHGASTKEQPVAPVRLAFEPEAAEALVSEWYDGYGCRPSTSPAIGQECLSSPSTQSYVHTYRNKRDLKLLLVDGMSAGKTNYGTLDTQNLVLLEGKQLSKDHATELNRAKELCEVVQPWGYDGLIRAGIGFEILSCNFTATVTQMKVKRTFLDKEKIGDGSMNLYQWVRAAAQRYDGLGARLKLDFSSMVSGLFYPINATNPDILHPEFSRLAATPMKDLRVMKDRVAEIAKADFQAFLIDWRYIVDTIVERFSDRLAVMADGTADDAVFINEIEAAAISYINAPTQGSDNEDAVDEETLIKQSIKDCSDHFLYPALPFSQRWNQADHMLYHSVITVTGEICTAFIQGWWDLRSTSASHGGNMQKVFTESHQRATLRRVRSHFEQLTDRLGWTTWRKIRPCHADEAMLVAMWPYGDVEDHSNPGCRNISQLVQSRTGYWDPSYSDSAREALPPPEFGPGEL